MDIPINSVYNSGILLIFGQFRNRFHGYIIIVVRLELKHVLTQDADATPFLLFCKADHRESLHRHFYEYTTSMQWLRPCVLCTLSLDSFQNCTTEVIVNNEGSPEANRCMHVGCILLSELSIKVVTTFSENLLEHGMNGVYQWHRKHHMLGGTTDDVYHFFFYKNNTK